MAEIVRLLTLVALVIMPFGMTAASAKSGHHAPAIATAQHSDGHDGHGGRPAEPAPEEAIDCAIACSMLMIAEARIAQPAPAVRLPVKPPLLEVGSGLHPAPAIPPPKHS
jgi:hypothetical protein